MPSQGETIRVESTTRWDALDLLGRLGGLHTYLVQLGDRTWLVCVRVEGPDDAAVPVVREAAEAWATERRLDSRIQIGERAFEVHGSETST